MKTLRWLCITLVALSAPALAGEKVDKAEKADAPAAETPAPDVSDGEGTPAVAPCPFFDGAFNAGGQLKGNLATLKATLKGIIDAKNGEGDGSTNAARCGALDQTLTQMQQLMGGQSDYGDPAGGGRMRADQLAQLNVLANSLVGVAEQCKSPEAVKGATQTTLDTAMYFMAVGRLPGSAIGMGVGLAASLISKFITRLFADKTLENIVGEISKEEEFPKIACMYMAIQNDVLCSEAGSRERPELAGIDRCTRAYFDGDGRVGGTSMHEAEQLIRKIQAKSDPEAVINDKKQFLLDRLDKLMSSPINDPQGGGSMPFRDHLKKIGEVLSWDQASGEDESSVDRKEHRQALGAKVKKLVEAFDRFTANRRSKDPAKKKIAQEARAELLSILLSKATAADESGSPSGFDLTEIVDAYWRAVELPEAPLAAVRNIESRIKDRGVATTLKEKQLLYRRGDLDGMALTGAVKAFRKQFEERLAARARTMAGGLRWTGSSENDADDRVQRKKSFEAYAIPLLQSCALTASMHYLQDGEIEGRHSSNKPTLQRDQYRKACGNLVCAGGIPPFAVTATVGRFERHQCAMGKDFEGIVNRLETEFTEKGTICGHSQKELVGAGK